MLKNTRNLNLEIKSWFQFDVKLEDASIYVDIGNF